MILQISRATTNRLIDVVERNRRRIVDQMLQGARDALHQRSLALNLLAGTFVDRFVDSLSEGDPQKLIGWIRSLEESNETPSMRQIFAAGCATIAAEYRTAGCEGADMLAFFANVTLEIERAVSATAKSVPAPVPLAELRAEAVGSLIAVLSSHDAPTVTHGKSVGAWSGRIARFMKFIPETIEFIERCGLLHDIGKFAVPTLVLNKPGPLDEAEWLIMKKHAEMGADILKQIPSLRECAPIVRSHHERYDGAGYPDGLKGSQIPIASRIIAVADAYDAMVARRPYRQSASPAQALATLLSGSNTQWDPTVIDAFVSLFGARDQTQSAVRSA